MSYIVVSLISLIVGGVVGALVGRKNPNYVEKFGASVDRVNK